MAYAFSHQVCFMPSSIPSPPINVSSEEFEGLIGGYDEEIIQDINGRDLNSLFVA